MRSIEMRKQGLSYRQILEVVPVAKSTLSLWLRGVGLSKRQNQQLTDRRIAAAKRGAESRRRTKEDTIQTDVIFKF